MFELKESKKIKLLDVDAQIISIQNLILNTFI